jgi:hypothetical protein
MPVGMLVRRLRPHGAPTRQAQRAGIAQPAHAVQHAEIVIERTVFLHVDDHVLDIHDRARVARRRDRQRPIDQARPQSACRKRARHAARLRRRLEEIAPVAAASAHARAFLRCRQPVCKCRQPVIFLV